jgi:hypothetical protein
LGFSTKRGDKLHASKINDAKNAYKKRKTGSSQYRSGHQQEGVDVRILFPLWDERGVALDHGGSKVNHGLIG